MTRALAIVGYGFGALLFGGGAVSLAWPMLRGVREFGSGGPMWVPAAVFAVMGALCAVGLYQALTARERG